MFVQKLLQKAGEQHIRQPSADSSGCSSGQESVTSSLTADSQVSSDSGTEVDQAPVSPDKLLETLPTWESNSLRQRNVGAARPTLATETTHWDTYVKVGKSGEPLIGETMSLARSTPNLTDSTGYTTSQHTWSSTGYISMPSSEELSSNPSPVPRENPNAAASTIGYSVVGILPKTVRINDNGMRDNADGTSIAIKPETKTSTIPYVTLAAMEQKSREQKQPVGMFRNLDELTFEPNQKVDAAASHLNVDRGKKVSLQPYVQAGGLMDSFPQPFSLNPVELGKCNSTFGSSASTSLIDTCNKPFVSSFAMNPTLLVTCNSLVESPLTSTKSYVPASLMSEVTNSLNRTADDTEFSSRKPYVWQVPTSENSSNPYVPVSFLEHRTQHPQEEKEEKELYADLIQDYDDKSDEEDDITYPARCWQDVIAYDKESAQPDSDVTQQSIGYIAIPKKSNPEQQQQQHQVSSVTTTLPSSHERFEKTSPSPQTVIASQSTDELYSKVMVVPSTIQ